MLKWLVLGYVFLTSLGVYAQESDVLPEVQATQALEKLKQTLKSNRSVLNATEREHRRTLGTLFV